MGSSRPCRVASRSSRAASSRSGLSRGASAARTSAGTSSEPSSVPSRTSRMIRWACVSAVRASLSWVAGLAVIIKATSDGTPHDGVVLRGRVADPGDAFRRDVVAPDQPLLGGGHEPGDGAAGDARGAARFVHPRGDLADAAEESRRVVEQGLDAEDIPAAAVFSQKRRGHRDVLGFIDRAAGHGEHQHPLAGAEHGAGFAVHDPADVGEVILVAHHRHPPGEIGRRADGVEMMIAPERRIGMAADPGQQHPLLQGGGVGDLALEAAIGGLGVMPGGHEHQSVGKRRSSPHAGIVGPEGVRIQTRTLHPDVA